jgi:hypothetical protein
MMNYSNGDQVERNCDLVLVKFLEQCWQLEDAPSLDVMPSARLIEIDETGQGHPALSRSTIAMWVPLLWLYL